MKKRQDLCFIPKKKHKGFLVCEPSELYETENWGQPLSFLVSRSCDFQALLHLNPLTSETPPLKRPNAIDRFPTEVRDCIKS